MEQQSDEWLEWRKKGIGSSDAPVIMGVSPWKTPFQLWEEKTGRAVEEIKSTFITDRGNELEPVARARYELEMDIEMQPALCQHSEYEWLRASMDGRNPEKKRGLEIKFVGENDFKLAKEQGVVPHKYFPQIQHQFLVTGDEQIDFYGYSVEKGAENHHGKSVIVPTFPDFEYIKKLFAEEEKFWMHIVTDVPPPFVEKDFKLLRVKGAKALADEWVNISKFIDTFVQHPANVSTIDDHRALLSRASSVLLEMAGDLKRARIGKLRIENGVISVYENQENTQHEAS